MLVPENLELGEALDGLARAGQDSEDVESHLGNKSVCQSDTCSGRRHLRSLREGGIVQQQLGHRLGHGKRGIRVLLGWRASSRNGCTWERNGGIRGE